MELNHVLLVKSHFHPAFSLFHYLFLTLVQFFVIVLVLLLLFFFFIEKSCCKSPKTRNTRHGHAVSQHQSASFSLDL